MERTSGGGLGAHPLDRPERDCFQSTTRAVKCGCNLSDSCNTLNERTKGDSICTEYGTFPNCWTFGCHTCSVDNSLIFLIILGDFRLIIYICVMHVSLARVGWYQYCHNVSLDKKLYPELIVINQDVQNHGLLTAIKHCILGWCSNTHSYIKVIKRVQVFLSDPRRSRLASAKPSPPVLRFALSVKKGTKFFKSNVFLNRYTGSPLGMPS